MNGKEAKRNARTRIPVTRERTGKVVVVDMNAMVLAPVIGTGREENGFVLLKRKAEYKKPLFAH
ncbi:hypothetical protein I8J29_28470 [Paenibacillus sp. MWE-103]|uniref:Transposase n=1 Tax=Paenibacillus artemisiicola TaxID=1172618 RepID=A0ABS3WIJ0_9BACL|nr:hypothetical protein [Paenibacillus artemisiicola]MBO7748133.1 hypothetical protein [Paenibacillus artemisiicola]